MGIPLYAYLGTRNATAGSVFCTSWLNIGYRPHGLSRVHVEVQVGSAASFFMFRSATNGILGNLGSGASMTNQLLVNYEATSLVAGGLHSFDVTIAASEIINFGFGDSVSVDQLYVDIIQAPVI